MNMKRYDYQNKILGGAFKYVIKSKKKSNGVYILIPFLFTFLCIPGT